MTDAEPKLFVIPTRVENLFAIPADRNLTGAEIELHRCSRASIV